MRVWAFLLFLPLAGCLDGGPAAPPETPEAEGAQPDAALLADLEQLAAFPEVRFDTDHGAIRMLLYTDWLPQTTAHIGGLVEDGFYDDTIIHRVVDDFVIQGGDPTQTGEGGSGPGGLSTEPVPLEIKEGLQFGSGAVGLARWTEDTGDSQWFITEKPALHLNDPQGQPNELLGPYALFAQVFEGMDVVRHIAAVDTLPNDRPITDVVVHTAELLPPPDADLFALRYTVIEPFDAWLPRDAAVEHPLTAVVGHPFTVRLIVPSDACTGSAAGNHWGMVGDPESHEEVPFHATSDPCTFEATYRPTVAGQFTFTGTDSVRPDVPRSFEIPVLPWHDAYAPFTGTVMNAS